MLKNYIKFAFRNFSRSKNYALINIIGLAIGICACIFIALWVQNEITYDKNHENYDHIYRVLTKHYYGSQQSWGTGSPPAVGPAMKTTFPEVLNSCRLQNGTHSTSVKYGNKLFKEELQMADASIFEVFTLPLIAGSYEKAFHNNHVTIISQEIAHKYFENENPIGKTLLIDNEKELEVIGILQDIPENSSIKFDFFAPLEILNDIYSPNNTKTWFNCSFNTYVILQPGTDHIDFREKTRIFITDNYPESDTEPYVYPLSKQHMYLYGYRGLVIIIAVIGGLILMIACINFINLSTSFAMKRAREVGLRKLVGAKRIQLINQFFVESILITLISTILGLALAEIFSSQFVSLTNSKIEIFSRNNLIYLSILPLAAILIGSLAGFYPAIVLSSFKPVTTLKQSTHRFGGRSILRKVLVTLQFVIAIILLVCTFVIINQSNFMLTKDLGYNKEHLVYVPLQGFIKDNPEIYRKALEENTNIQNITFLGRNPTEIWTNGSGWEWEEKPEDLDPFVTYQGVDTNYLETFQIDMLHGNFYDENSDATAQIVINESFAKVISDDNPVGITLHHEDDTFQIAGVTKNFHFKSAHHKVGAIAMYLNTNNDFKIVSFRYAYMRISAENMQETLKFIKHTTHSLTPDYPYELKFLEADVEKLYLSEVQTSKLITSFAFLAVFISCLGLLGLSTLITQQRIKEIGIRKVLGSTISQIVALLTSQFVKWVLIANLIAWPVSYYIMESWLRNFPYKITLSIWYFIFSGLTALIIAFGTISLNTIRAANRNPVESLRYE